MAKYIKQLAGVLALLAVAGVVYAGGGDLGQAEKQPTNWTAIMMFGAFVVGTLFITKWAAAKTKPAADFYTRVAASPASRTVWLLRGTTCPPHPSSVFLPR